jgi:PhnB protein
MAVKPIPEGYHSVTPYLLVQDAAAALDFYQRALGAAELFRLMTPDGQIGHAEIKVGNSPIMLADDCDTETAWHNPKVTGSTSIGLHVYVEDVDTLFAQSVAAGATVIRPVEDQFYGDRTGTLQDPFGHVWFLATHREDLTPEEIDRRARERFGGSIQGGNG